MHPSLMSGATVGKLREHHILFGFKHNPLMGESNILQNHTTRGIETYNFMKGGGRAEVSVAFHKPYGYTTFTYLNL